MKYSDLKSLLQQGRLEQFQSQIQKQTLPSADYNLLLRQFIKTKVKNFQKYFNLLIKKGADVNFVHIKDKKSNLMVACEEGSLQSVQLLCSHPQIDFNLQDTMKKTAPFYAIQNKNKNDGQIFLDKVLKLAPQLIKRPANNETMLILGIKKQKPQLVRILLAHKADPNYIITDSGNTSLHQALKLCKTKQTQKNKQIVKALLQFGADPYIKNKKAKDSFEFAEKFDLASLVNQTKGKITSHFVQNKQISTPKQDQQNKNIPTNNNSSKRQIKQNRQVKQSNNKQTSAFGYSTNNNNQISTNKKLILKLNTQKQIDDLIKNTQKIYKRQKQSTNKMSPLQLSKKQQQYIRVQTYNSYVSQSQQSQDDQQILQNQNKQNLYCSYNKSQKITQQLTKQIQQLSKTCQQNFINSSKDIQDILRKINQLAFNQNLDVKIYGSFSTGLWLKNCDIDLVLIPHDQFIAQKDSNYVQNILDRFQIILKNQPYLNIKNCNKNKKIKVPMIRFQIQYTSNTNNNGIGSYNSLSYHHKLRKFDVTVIDRNHNGLAIAHYISQNLKVFPNLKPLFYTIKSLCYHYKLCDPKNGGIRTYAIIIMLLSFLQNLQIRFNSYSLGELLLRFLFFFGFQYQYGYGNSIYSPLINQQGNSNNNSQDLSNSNIQSIERQPIMLLTIYDPLNHTNNVGKNSKAYELQAMFKAAYIGLHSNIKGKKIQFIFDMKKIILPF